MQRDPCVYSSGPEKLLVELERGGQIQDGFKK